MTPDKLAEAIERVRRLFSPPDGSAMEDVLTVCDAAQRCALVEASFAPEREAAETLKRERDEARAQAAADRQYQTRAGNAERTLAGIERLLRAGWEVSGWSVGPAGTDEYHAAGAIVSKGKHCIVQGSLADSVRLALAELDKETE